MRQLNYLLVSAIAVAGLTLSGCIFLRSSSISDVSGKGTPISTQATDLGFLRLVPPKNLTEAAASQLASQCQTGKLTDVQTEMNVRDIFIIVQMYEVDANGVCL